MTKDGIEKNIDRVALERDVHWARRARQEAQEAGFDLENLIARMRGGFSLKEIELGLADIAPADSLPRQQAA